MDARRTAETHMIARRWSDAADALARVATPESSDRLRLTLCKNLASLQQHRAEIYQTLMGVTNGDRYSVGRSATGRPTVVQRHDDGRHTILSANNDPLGSLKSILTQIADVQRAGQPIALCGFGDGYLLDALAQNAPTLLLGRLQPIYAIDPDPEAVLATLMIHDFTGPSGAIEQERILWFVGAHAIENFRTTMLENAQHPFPLVNISLSAGSKAIEADVKQVLADLLSLDRETQKNIDAYYRTIAASDRAAIFSTDPARRPRVLLITTRFSTVIQFSTRDTADAFEQLGWEARVVIEQRAHHGLTPLSIRQAILDFKPDLVFQIDHQRAEYQGLFPPQLPFVCWFQDHLPNLQNPDAARAITPLDFVLTDATPMYVARYGYPARQCIALSKLTRVPKTLARPASRDEAGDDIAFVSNASHDPAKIAVEAIANVKGGDTARELMTECCDAMLKLYRDGGCLQTYAHLCRFLRAVQHDGGFDIDTESFDRLAYWLTHPFNDALYRQQAIRWAASIADEMGLTLSLYGKNWDQHPEFARFARGYASYGGQLEELTRRTRINLQVVPFVSLHQRLLDGLVAGGFFLVRDNVADQAPQVLLDFLESHGAAGARTVAEARSSIAPASSGRLEAVLAFAAPTLSTRDDEDPIELMREFQGAGLIVPHAEMLPRMSEVRFTSQPTLRKAIERFVHDADARAQIIEAQRNEVAARLSYTAGMKRVARCIGERLGKQTIQMKAAA